MFEGDRSVHSVCCFTCWDCDFCCFSIVLFILSFVVAAFCLLHSTSDAFGRRVVVRTAVQFGISPLRHPMPFAANSCNYSLIRAGNWELQSRRRDCDSAIRVCCNCENTYQTTGPCRIHIDKHTVAWDHFLWAILSVLSAVSSAIRND